MWFLPSRSRAGNVKRFFEAYRRTGAVSPGVLRIDADDAGDYLGIELPVGWSLHIGQRMTLGEMTNEFFQLNPLAPWYGLIGDDVVPVTLGWDKTLISLAGRCGIAYPNDNHQAPQLACHMVIGGDLVREMGWLALPGLDRLYIDTVWTDIGRGRAVMVYAPGVLVEHYHFSNGKAPMDAVYKKPNAQRDALCYEAWRANA